MLLFQSLPWKSKAENQKRVPAVCKFECGESKRDHLLGFWKEKARAREQKKWNLLNFHNEKNQLAKFFSCVVCCGEKSPMLCVGRDVEYSKLF